MAGIKTYMVEWKKTEAGRWDMQEIPGKSNIHIYMYVM